jgi:hypothetical protein
MLQLPKPYQDEAVGSVLLRAQMIYGVSIKRLLSWVYGCTSARSSHSFHLSSDVTRIAELCGMSPREFLYGHTVFPYATACLPKGYAGGLEARFLGEAEPRPFSIASLVYNVTQGAPARKYCTDCACLDIKNHGETYWRRLHQLPTVLVCPTHLTALVHTGVRTSLTHGSASLHRPSTVYLRPGEPAFGMAPALTLAKFSEDLLTGRFDRDADWHEGYKSRARLLGFAHHYGAIASGVSALALSEFYGEKYLGELGCEVKKPLSNSWPALLLRSSRNQYVSVVRHLLMQAFLEHTRLDDRLRKLIDRVEKPPRRDFQRMDQVAEMVIRREISKHANSQTRTTVGQLLDAAGLRSIYRHDRSKFPRCRALLETFRSSDQSARQLGGSAYWRSRIPSKWGLLSKRNARTQAE